MGCVSTVSRVDNDDETPDAEVSDVDIRAMAREMATAIIELVLHVADQVGATELEELTQSAPLRLITRHEPHGDVHEAVQIQVIVRPADDRRHSFEVRSRPADPGCEPRSWTVHATGRIVADSENAGNAAAGMATTLLPLPANAVSVSLDGLYPRLARDGYRYGPAFQGLRDLHRCGDDLYAHVVLPPVNVPGPDRFVIHPALLDAALHALRAVTERPERTLVPFAWAGVRAHHAPPADELWVRLRAVCDDVTALEVTDSTGRRVISVERVTWREISRQSLQASDQTGATLYHLDWAPLPAEVARGQACEPPDAATPTCAVLALNGEIPVGPGPNPFGGLPEGTPSYPDLDALHMAGSLPDVVLVHVCGHSVNDGPPPAEARELTAQVLELLQAWVADQRLARSRLVLVTHGAVRPGDGSPVVAPRPDVRARSGDVLDSPAAAAVWGMTRAAAIEHPGRLALVDLDRHPSSPAALSRALAGVVGAEPELAVRLGELLVPRLAQIGPRVCLQPPVDRRDWRVDVVDRGTLDGVGVVDAPAAERRLGPGEVRVAVRAAGVNFRDVVLALGMIGPEALGAGSGHPTMGLEGAGVVLETGPGVTRFRVGDRVLGLFPEAFGPLAVADHRTLAPVPDGWTYPQAASVPVVFLTAWYGLDRLAGLGAGERVLIHAAAGGVGMAAGQLARLLGAEVFATASPTKWEVLRGQGLPGERIASSRDLDFEQQFLDATRGAGMDVVLDCLAGDFVDASLRLLPRGGRFVELGKTDLREADQVAATHPGVAYHAFDLLRLDPELLQAMLGELMPLFASGALTPIPVTAWELPAAPQALRRLGQASTVGKVVLTLPPQPNPDGTVLITGGTGGLGLRLAHHLVTQHRVRRLLLVGRRGAAAEGVAAALSEMSALGAEVEVAACDVADRASVAQLLARVPADHPLTAVVHAAGVLDDGPLGSLTADRVASVLRVKADAAWNLHELTTELDLHDFVFFSSVVGLLGNVGQSGYAAANAFLDSLAGYRRSQGLPARSLAWGLWDGEGMGADLRVADRERLARNGILPMSAKQGLALYDAAAASGLSVAVPARLRSRATGDDAPPSPLLWSLGRQAAHDQGRSRQGAVHGSGPTIAGSPGEPKGTAIAASDAATSLHEKLSGLSTAQRRQVISDVVARVGAGVLHLPTEAVVAEQTFKEAGFDSLIGVEFRNRLAAGTSLRLPSTLVFDHPTPSAVVSFLEGELATSVDRGGVQPQPERLVAELDRLQSAVLAVGPDSGYDAVVGRLEELLRHLRGATSGTSTTSVADQLASASDDEIFALIDNDLGSF